jgi:hypothetical protein
MNLDALKNIQKKLKKTETVVKEMPTGTFEKEVERVPLQSSITVLLLTVNHKIYEWLGPKKEIKKILITNKYNEEKMNKTDIEEYEHIEWIEKYDSPIVEWKAFELHKKYKFDRVNKTDC